jgi:hypothetical protein
MPILSLSKAWIEGRFFAQKQPASPKSFRKGRLSETILASALATNEGEPLRQLADPARNIAKSVPVE